LPVRPLPLAREPARFDALLWRSVEWLAPGCCVSVPGWPVQAFVAGRPCEAAGSVHRLTPAPRWH